MNYCMKDTPYNNIYVVGAGTTPLLCTQYLHDLGLNCEFMDTAHTGNTISYRRANKLGINYRTFNEHEFMQIVSSPGQKLIFSVNNLYIFPHKITDLPYIRIINYHNSLLPKHRGVHAEAWAIYDGDAYSGITWHYVDAGIDTGDIVFQSKICISNSTTSISLLQEQSKLAVDSLKHFFPSILNFEVKQEPQPHVKFERPHLKRDIPNDGELSTTFNINKAWRFLRAMDYGPLNTLGIPFIIYNGIKFSWRTYEYIDSNKEMHGIFKYGNDLIFHNKIILKNIFLL